MKYKHKNQIDAVETSCSGTILLQQRVNELGIEQIEVMTRDVRHLNRLALDCIRADQNSKSKSNTVHVERLLATFTKQLQSSGQRRQQRASVCPEPSYDSLLPISAKVEEIRDAIIKHPVVVIAGDTGSGKSTQIPKICLQAGRGVRGFIGHTQPRRIAARSIAERVSEELKSDLGAVVGYKVRFDDQTRPESYIKLMTDGILLAELQRDRFLMEYDTIIIDEAHERSLNIDFILGYLKTLLRKRDDLKVIITSATIDTQKFSKHFENAPVITVEGRTYPVEVHYVDINKNQKDDVSGVVRQTVETIVKKHKFGDILVFLSGEAEIRRCMEVLNKRNILNSLVLPLYSRLANNAQHAVFTSSKKRKIILATNIAETSLTIPGIKFVIDPGYARISRYNFRRKVQRLPIEKISQASANQRKGRCGRISEGVCYRLYTLEDFEQRPEFTEPEIKRSNLATVILQMEASKLGDINSFAFIDPPDAHYISDGYKLLFELAAVDEQQALTKIGRQLARYPVDPRLAKMLIAAVHEQCSYEMVIIVSALSIQDIREHSPDTGTKNTNAAQLARSVFYEENGAKQSDFIFYLNVWEEVKHFRMGELKRFCKQYYFSFLRMIEWRDIVKQINGVVKEVSKVADFSGTLASYNQIHRAILPGLLSLVGVKNDDGSYQAPRNCNFLVSHRSGLHKKPVKWIMSESLVHTNRLYANNVAKIYPKWIEQMASHVIKTSYYDIDWDTKGGGVIAYENTTLYGLTIQSRRKVDYGKKDPAASQPIFIQKALVERQLKASIEIIKNNFELFVSLERLEAKFRVRNIIVNDANIFSLYQSHIPASVCSEETLRMWVKSNPEQASRLRFQQNEVCNLDVASLNHDDFPDTLSLYGHRLQLSYIFEPGHVDDGISVDVPIFLLANLQETDFDCLVPGMLKQKLVALIKSLPKSIRTSFIPASDYSGKCVAAIIPGKDSILNQFSTLLQNLTSKKVAVSAWNVDKLPVHLKMNFRVRANNGVLLNSGRELSLLQFLLSSELKHAEADVPKNELERDGITCWDFGKLPHVVQIKVDDFTIEKYPAIIDKQDSVSIKLYSDVNQAKEVTRAGLRRLFVLTHVKKVEYMRHNIPKQQKMSLLYASLGSAVELQQMFEDLIIDTSLYENANIEDFRNEKDFSMYADKAEKSLLLVMNEMSELLFSILNERHSVVTYLSNMDHQLTELKSDIESQLCDLFFTDFIIKTPIVWLRRYPAYMQAISKRINNYAKSPAADKDRYLRLEVYKLAHQELTRDLDTQEVSAHIIRFRWMLEEFRISLFAQGIRTVEPISQQRLDRQLLLCRKA